jgi:hypothetical protein
MGVMIDGPADPKSAIVDIPDIGTFQAVQSTPGQLPVLPSPPEWANRQVGGNHYRTLAIQPLTYIIANRLKFAEGNIVKLVSRYRDKGGLEDLDKLIHYAQVLREEYARELER